MRRDDTSDAARPDGRISSPETLRLRRATRALRLHLDELPVEFHFWGPGDQFLAECAFPFARQRYDCAESMIGAGFGGTVLGSIARSLFDDGLRWFWIGDDPGTKRVALLGSMLEERNRVCMAMESDHASCPILPRWFAPLIGVTDLTGSSEMWLRAPAVPDQAALLADFLGGVRPTNATQDELLDEAQDLLNISGLRGAVMILAHAGHGNLLGTQSSLTERGGIGHDLRPDHEALYMQVAAVGVTLTLLGVSRAVPESWPSEVPQRPFLVESLRLTTEIVKAATVIHGLGAPKRPKTLARRRNPRPTPLLRPAAVLSPDDLLPDVNSADEVAEAAERYYEAAKSWMANPWREDRTTNLASILTYGGAHSSLQAVMSTYDQPGSAVIAVFAARMLLEEAARFKWMIEGRTEDKIAHRFTQFFEDQRARRKKVLDEFSGDGVARSNAETLLALPSNVTVITPHDSISKNRKQMPPIEKMLAVMGEPYPEPGWLNVAYSLLSQVTHSTPIGHLHMTRYREGTLYANEISAEMLGLTLDAACLGSAHLIGISASFLTAGSQEARDYSLSLHRLAYDVHNRARLVHGLD
ncbi:hypothetical protein Psi02_64210 [Planotetraspora silvatica]|uniref:Uncharacterized protein n=1 Tax=Planotetraspora silvatica TaxID=234614 RepID=A0A8J3URK5_9ACTN|nr:hypothetical protein [Planotetraspora silvatica]GII49997.1 hypothetical protein Psi02_64210 [Planotetraspora silvatica]